MNFANPLLEALNKKQWWALIVAFLPPVYLVGLVYLIIVGVRGLFEEELVMGLEKGVALFLLAGSLLWPLLYYFNICTPYAD